MLDSSPQDHRPTVRIARPHIPDNEKMILMPLEIRLRAFKSYLTPEVEAQLQEEFADYWDQDQFPVLLGNRLIDRVCETALKDYPLAKAREMLGYAYLIQYQDSFLGVLLAPVDNTENEEAGADFDWVMQGLPRNYSAATIYGIYSITKIEPRHWRFDFEDDPGYPDFILGTLRAGSDFLKVPNHRNHYTVSEPGCISFHLYWG